MHQCPSLLLPPPSPPRSRWHSDLIPNVGDGLAACKHCRHYRARGAAAAAPVATSADTSFPSSLPPSSLSVSPLLAPPGNQYSRSHSSTRLTRGTFWKRLARQRRKRADSQSIMRHLSHAGAWVDGFGGGAGSNGGAGAVFPGAPCVRWIPHLTGSRPAKPTPPAAIRSIETGCRSRCAQRRPGRTGRRGLPRMPWQRRTGEHRFRFGVREI